MKMNERDIDKILGFEPVTLTATFDYNSCFKNKTPTLDTKVIKDVIFNDPATIVFWSDGTKTVVKCGQHDVFDPEKGLAMAICKKMFGNTNSFHKIFKKFVPDHE